MEEFLKLLSVRDILLHTANTLILFIAIRLLVYKPVRRFLNARTEKIAAQLEGAAQTQALAEQALVDAQAQRRDADTAAGAAQMEAASRAQQTGETLIEAAKKEAEAIREQARADAVAIRQQAQEEMQQEALTMAVTIAERMIGRELSVKDNDQLAREFLTKVG